MDTRNILFSLLFITCFSASVGEQLGNHVININSCCSSQALDVKCDKGNESLLSNISTILKEHEKRLEGIIQSLDTGSRIRDCEDIQRFGKNATGIYMINPKGSVTFPVRCDMDTAGGGWTVIQRRISDSDFYKNWYDYQIGFGNQNENFWLGNQQMHVITEQGWYKLRVDLESMDSSVAYAEYNVFSVGNLDSGYKLSVDGYRGNAGDSLAHHNGRKFSTKDRDNDNHSSFCAQVYTGAWWYGNCHDSNLNGKYGATAGKGPVWETFKGTDGPLKITEMKIRRWHPPAN